MDVDMIPQFIIKNGLRKVAPYNHTNNTYVKGRWIGKKVLQVFNTEFQVKPIESYRKQIIDKKVVLIRNGETISGPDLLDLNMQEKDILSTTGHKHEAVVPNFGKIPIIHQDENFLVLNKPAGIPVHPTGRFYYNSVTETIKLQENIPNVFQAYRLDKLTSGVLLVGKNSETARMIHTKILEKGLTKNYYARVVGNFPDGEIVSSQPVFHVIPKKGYEKGIGSKKSATTIFKKIRYNSELNESIVLCKPQTGRIHQIRIHLNYLNHPIVNDPLYGPNASEIRRKIIRSVEVSLADFHELVQESKENYKNLVTEEVCEVCGHNQFEDDDPKDLIMYLHAIKYASNDGEWCFETSEPEWANI